MLQPLYLAPADVAAAKAGREADRVDRAIGLALRLAHGLAAGADVQHPAAVGDEALALGGGSRLEYLDAFGFGLLDPRDRAAFFRSPGIAFGRHHHGQRRPIG